MPTKPSVASPPFATSLNYTAGARIGDPTKLAIPDVANGYTPGITIEPESFNFYGNELLTWISTWVALGSSSDDQDAHIVETDAAGLADLASLDVGGTTYASFLAALTVTNNTGSGSSRAILATSATQKAIEAQNNSTTNAAILAGNSDVGPAFQANPFAGGVGLLIACSTNDSTAADLTGFGLGQGLLSEGGASGEGVRAIGGASSATAYGVHGIAQHDDAHAIRGITTVGANAGACGVEGIGRADADGVHGVAADGYGVVAESTNANRASLRVEPQTTAPSSSFSGDIWYASDTDTLDAEIKSQPMALHATQWGFTEAFAEIVAIDTQIGTVMKANASATIPLPYEPRIAGGYIEIRAMFESSVTITGNAFVWQIYDVTAAAIISGPFTETHYHGGTGADEKYVTLTTRYLLPTTGSRNIDIQYANAAGGGASHIRKSSITIHGVFPAT